MSGPKTSHYTLTAEQRRILAEQRELQLRMVQAHTRLNQASKQLFQYSNMFNNEAQKATELLKRTGDDGGLIHRIDELRKLVKPVRSVINNNSESIDVLENMVIDAETNLKKAEIIAKEIAETASNNELLLSKNLNENIDKGFNSSFADVQLEHGDELKNLQQETQSKLLKMMNNTVLPEWYKEEIERANENLYNIKDISFIRNFLMITIDPIIKKCSGFLAEYEQYHEEFDTLSAEYMALCNLYYFIPQQYECSATGIEAIKAENARMKAIAKEDDEQAYISNCLDEVMTEMGYSVLGSRDIVKKNGKHFQHELYSYGEGIAVNVTYSPDGKIAMELGGMDTADRLPNEYETAELCNAMESFCDDFKKIEKTLAQKGVIVGSRVSMLPPTAEHAQIINTSEYKMQSEAEKLQTKKDKRKASKTQTMQAES